MSRYALAFFLTLLGSPLPASDGADPSAKRPSSLLRDTFEGVLPKEKLANLQGKTNPEKLVGQMSPEEKAGATVKLAALEGQAKEPEDLREIAKGYLMLGAHEDAVRVAAALRELEPQNPQGHFLAARAYEKLGNQEQAAEAALVTLKLDPKNAAAHSIYMLNRGRVSASGGGGPRQTPPGEADASSEQREQVSNSPSPLPSALPGEVAKSVLANVPAPPALLAEPPSSPAPGDSGGAANKVFTLALVATGGFLLFGGLGGKQLEERFPNIRRDMGIAAGISGVVAVGALSFPALTAPMANSFSRVLQSEAGAVRTGSLPQGLAPVGRNLDNVRRIATGRLRGFNRGNTELPGGESAAKALFQKLTGRAPASNMERLTLGDGREIVYRGASKSGVPKIEIVDHQQKFLEKISFLTEAQ